MQLTLYIVVIMVLLMINEQYEFGLCLPERELNRKGNYV